MATFFNEYFGVTADQVDDHGAFNVSIINDLPLFIDPFLLFNSEKAEYQQLHNDILKYMIFLRDAVAAGRINDDLVNAWFLFPEVKQNWFGFSLSGNGGSGLGRDFATALRANLLTLFSNFGRETISRGSHIEKVCLVRSGIGRDMISDFTTNLVKHFLCKYTEEFAVDNIDPARRKKFWINKVRFNYQTESWDRGNYDLPWLRNDFVLLTPKDIPTRDENWINRTDMLRDFASIPVAIPDAELRGQVSNYFESVLAKPINRGPSQRERDEAAVHTLIRFPQLVDYYIKIKENSGDEATDISSEKVLETKLLFETHVRQLQESLASNTASYSISGDTYTEAHQRLAYLKDVIEHKGGHRIFYNKGVAPQRESDLQILYRFVWFGSPSDVGTEANDGRGPAIITLTKVAQHV